MITRCDHCGSKFEVSAELVNSADPGVRCGECLALFDARANLYDEAEYRKSAAMLRPVQKRRPAVKQEFQRAEIIDAGTLETADTVAVEHIYTSAGVKNRELGKQGNNPDNYSLSDRRSEQRIGRDPLAEPVYTGRDQQVGYGQSRNYNLSTEYTDFEFERTLATESALPERAEHYKRKDNLPIADSSDTVINNNANHRDVYRSAPIELTDDLSIESIDEPTVTRVNTDAELPTTAHKRQKLRDQEQRALQIEPERDFSELSSVDIALDQSMSEQRRSEFYRSEIERMRVSDRSRIDDRELARDSRIVNRGDTHFAPDDVVNQPGIIRDNGRRPEDATRFKPDTPEFDISLDADEDQGEEHSVSMQSPGSRERIDQLQRAAAPGDVEPELKTRAETLDNAQHEKPRHSEFAVESDLKNGVMSPYDDALYGDIESNRRDGRSHRSPNAGIDASIDSSIDSGADRRGLPRASRDPETRKSFANQSSARKASSYKSSAPQSSAPESSAQEMRRYQQYRPAVDVEHVAEDDGLYFDDELSVDGQQRNLVAKQSSAGLLFWAAGLVLAIGLLLFAARGLIANMNLPEPAITVFCQVTGCVPDQARKNVDQLQTMRKRLYPHPEIENAIVISVDIVNNSIYKQPLPILAVSLLNESDEIVAERDFSNTSYEVVDGSESGFLLPDEPTRLKIEVIDTGLAAVDVDLGFK